MQTVLFEPKKLNAKTIDRKLSVKEVAQHLVAGKVCLFPSQSVYTLIVDGKKIEAVQRLRRAKGRDQNQREGVECPPEKLFEYIDFQTLNRLNPKITKKVIKDLYKANPLGLIVPCHTKLVPEHLITYHTINGEKIATIMNIWNTSYKYYAALWKELSDHPEVMWVGSSANLSKQNPLSFQEARLTFADCISHSLEDPEIEKHPFQGSYTIISLIHNPPLVYRKGSIHPDKHPSEFQRFQKIIPNLVVPKENRIP